MFLFGGSGSGRKPNPKPIKPARYCAYCGKLLPEDTHGKQDHCNNACKQAAYRARKVRQ
jgi:predicted nucleic acid-binding Zn ribbon protein